MCGVDPDFGAFELSRAPEVYGSNQSMVMKINQFHLAMQITLKESMMSEMEKKNYYDQIPVMMHHMPHMYVVVL